MFNISRSNNSLLITSNDNSQFPWKDGKMSIPMNSVTYVIDESDYIAFRSISNNDILFTALIDEIQIEGESVTKDTIIEKFDAVANGSTGGSGGISNESDPIFKAWKNADNVIVGNGAKFDTDGASEEEIQPSIMIGKGANVLADGIAIGENAYSEMGAVAIGKNVTSYGIVSIGSDNEGGDIAIGKNNKGDGITIGKNNSGNGITIGENNNTNGIAIGDNISNPTDAGIAIGLNAKINTKNPDDTENGYGIAIGVASIAYDKNDVAIGRGVETDVTYTTNFNNILKGNASGFAFVKAADGSFVQINTEWTGTQKQYDALTTKYDTITYNIIEG